MISLKCVQWCNWSWKSVNQIQKWPLIVIFFVGLLWRWDDGKANLKMNFNPWRKQPKSSNSAASDCAGDPEFGSFELKRLLICIKNYSSVQCSSPKSVNVTGLNFYFTRVCLENHPGEYQWEFGQRETILLAFGCRRSVFDRKFLRTVTSSKISGPHSTFCFWRLWFSVFCSNVLKSFKRKWTTSSLHVFCVS